MAGLASGEGLIWAVRDPHGPDPGAADKRLLVIEPEFASVLREAEERVDDPQTRAYLRVQRVALLALAFRQPSYALALPVVVYGKQAMPALLSVLYLINIARVLVHSPLISKTQKLFMLVQEKATCVTQFPLVKDYTKQ